MRNTSILMASLASLLIPTLASANSLQSMIAAYEAADCAPVVEQEIKDRKIDQTTIRKIEYITIQLSPSDDFGEDYDYEGWINFSSCKGNYVISMDKACFIKQSYATHECLKKGIGGG